MSTTTEPTTYQPGTIADVPPTSLLLERNIRDAKPNQALVDSVGELGVLEPITAVVADDGRLLVRFGHRRTLAAIAAGLDTVPVYVRTNDDLSDHAEIRRVIAQHDENTHRSGLSAGDEVHVVEQLVAFGLSADDIAAQARIAGDRVDVALTVSRSKLASKSAEKYDALTLDQAAAIAEFDDDAEVAKALIVTALEDPTRFAHALQQRRDDRMQKIVHAAAVKELEDAGVTIVDPPGWESKTKATRLDYLVDAKGKNITAKGHATCPDHVAWVQLSWSWSKSEDGSDQRVIKAYVTYGCNAPAKNGHKDRYGSSSSTAAADMTPAEREKAKAERRLVIDNNKAWASAEVVRRDWLREFAQRKTPPKGAASFIAQALAGERMWLSDYRVPAIVLELLGGCTSSNSSLEEHVEQLLKGATENRAQVIALAQILAAIEATTSQQTWRGDGTTSIGGRYLRFLESAGYALSDVEKFACSKRTV